MRKGESCVFGSTKELSGHALATIRVNAVVRLLRRFREQKHMGPGLEIRVTGGGAQGLMDICKGSTT